MKQTHDEVRGMQNYLMETAGVDSVPEIATAVYNLVSDNKAIAGVCIVYLQTDALKFACPCGDAEGGNILFNKDNLIYRILEKGTVCCKTAANFTKEEIALFNFENENIKTIYVQPLYHKQRTIGLLLLGLNTMEPMLPKILHLCENLCAVLPKQLATAACIEANAQMPYSKEAQGANSANLSMDEQSRKVRQLYTMLSHEFKTPLNVMLTSLELLRLKLKTNNLTLYTKDYNELCDYMEKNIFLSLRLANNLLDSAKIEDEAMDLMLSDVDINHIVQQAVYNMQLLAQAKKISLAFENKLSNSKIIFCDAEKTERVILNLISNAIRSVSIAKPKAPCVKLTLSENKTHIVISISDNGEGISDAAQKHIFDKFYRARCNRLSQDDGSGLGLFISKAMIEMQKGEILVQSKLGLGSTFTFTISKALPAKTIDAAMHAATRHYQNDMEPIWAKMEYFNSI